MSKHDIDKIIDILINNLPNHLKDENKPQGQIIEVWAQDIQGIIYYIDKNYNVYQTEDIMQGKVNPKIIAHYQKNGDNFSIPEFNI